MLSVASLSPELLPAAAAGGQGGANLLSPSFSSVKYKRVNKYGFSTPGSEATVFEKTSRLDEGKAPTCVCVPATVILVLENSSAKEASLSGKGWDKDLRMEMEMKIGRAPELMGGGGSRDDEDCWRPTTYREALRAEVAGDSGDLQGGVQPLPPGFPSFPVPRSLPHIRPASLLGEPGTTAISVSSFS